MEPIPEDWDRAVAVVAHPDDLEYGMASAVARWTGQGRSVSYLIVTRGDAGGFDATPRGEMPRLREAEQRAAAAELGVKDVEFLDGYSDGRLTPTIELRRDIVRVLRKYRPARLICQSPERTWEPFMAIGRYHPDHLAAGQANQQLGHISGRGSVLAGVAAAMVDQPRCAQAEFVGHGVRIAHADRVEQHQGGDVVAFLNHQPRQLAHGQAVAHAGLQHATAVGPVLGPDLERSFGVKLAAVFFGQNLE